MNSRPQLSKAQSRRLTTSSTSKEFLVAILFKLWPLTDAGPQEKDQEPFEMGTRLVKHLVKIHPAVFTWYPPSTEGCKLNEA
jgi:hypothetical protein